LAPAVHVKILRINHAGIGGWCLDLACACLCRHQRERNHQGLDNLIPFPDERLAQKEGSITKAERLGGLLKFYYYREAA
jgi:hypothetical protein